jgi:hypothetical protein
MKTTLITQATKQTLTTEKKKALPTGMHHTDNIALNQGKTVTIKERSVRPRQHLPPKALASNSARHT